LRSSIPTRSFCDKCIFLSPTEEEQTSDKEPHICKEYNETLYHSGSHPRIPRLIKCLLDHKDDYPKKKGT